MRYYALTRTYLGAHKTWPAAVIGQLSTIAAWARSLAIRASFMFAQSWLTSSAIQHPVSALHIVTLVCASRLHYFNLSTYESFWWIARLAGDGIIYVVSLIHLVTGEQAPNTEMVILLVYIF